MTTGRHGGYAVRTADKEDRAGFLDLHSSVFGAWPDDIAADVFHWKYAANPYTDELPVIVVTSGGELVGARGYTGFELAVDGDTVLGLQSGDLMVHPDHRRQGLFTRMNALGLDHFGDDGVVFFSCPARAPRTGYLESGWERVRNTEFRRYPAARPGADGLPATAGAFAERAYEWCYRRYRSGLGVLQSPADGYTVDTRDELPVAELLALYEPPETIHVRRTEAFYRWRFASPLYETTTYLAVRDGAVTAAAVVDENERHLLLRELLPTAGAESALAALLARLRTEFPERTMAAWPLRDHRSALYRAGFLPAAVTPRARAATDLVVNSVGTATGGRELADAENWDLQLAARDY